MAKTNITQYSATPSSNTDINSINIDENCPASGLNNAIRELMAHLKNVDTGSQALTALSVTGDTTISSGNVLVGKTASDYSTTGTQLSSNGQVTFTSDGNTTFQINRKTSDGVIQRFSKDGTTVGEIGSLVSGRDLHVNSTGGILTLESNFNSTERQVVLGDTYFGVVAGDDNAVDLGRSSARYKNLYLSGGAYIGGTGSANYLDDVETGNWTPVYGGASVAPTVTYTRQKGSYVKVGNLVHVQGRISTSTTSGGSGSLRITGLPFTNINQQDHYSTLHISYNVGWATDKYPTGGLLNANTSHVTLYTARSSDARDGVGIVLNANNLTTGTNNNDIIFSMTYRAD